MVCASCRIHSPASSEDGANRVVGMVIQVSFPASMASMGVVNSGYHRECSAAGINETSRMTLIRRIASNKHRNESIRLCDLPRCHLASVVGPSTIYIYIYIYLNRGYISSFFLSLSNICLFLVVFFLGTRKIGWIRISGVFSMDLGWLSRNCWRESQWMNFEFREICVRINVISRGIFGKETKRKVIFF